MPARLELYRVFREVAESGSVSAAARSLYVSQSAVSQSIRQLEQQLQTRLFERSSRGVSLTADGKLLYEYVSKAIDLIGSGEEKLSKARALELGHLAIGASDTLTRRYLLPYL
jgi:molybdate transport repressor ModE-like protein